MHQQINEHFKTLLSKFQCGFRQGFSAQHCLLMMVEKTKKKKIEITKEFLLCSR